MDYRRSILWVIFTVSVIFLYNSWLRSEGKSGLFGEAARPVASAPGHAAAPNAAASAVPSALAAASPGTPPLAPGHAQAQQPATVTVVHTDLLDLKISSRGASVVYAALRHYTAQGDSSKPMVLFEDNGHRTYVAQSGLIGGSFPNHETPMSLLPGPLDMGDAKELTVRFRSPVVGGLQLTRSYTFHRGSYAVDVRDTVHNLGTTAVQPQLYMQLVRDDHNPSEGTHFYHTFYGAALYDASSKFEKFEFKDFHTQAKTRHADDGWVAVLQQYFATAWLPQPYQGAREFYMRKLSDGLYATGVLVHLPRLAPGAQEQAHQVLFIGPELQSQLQGLAPGFDLVRDYGWVTIIAKPLFWVLEQIERVLGNWGWSIIGLTILLKLAFFPLTAASYRSMARMKAVGPRLTALRERHKDDPQAMNAAMVEMYRKEKINPLGGCLPVVIQIPVFIALYWVLLSSVELRGAPWLGWIHDLSAKDPYYVLPLVMTATSFLQVKLNPTPPDPMQARLMWIMPLAFSVMFFFFPSGLVLYWLTNNIFSIAQQWFINRKMGVPEFSSAK